MTIKRREKIRIRLKLLPLENISLKATLPIYLEQMLTIKLISSNILPKKPNKMNSGSSSTEERLSSKPIKNSILKAKKLEKKQGTHILLMLNHLLLLHRGR
jgi:hypothetical protein